MKFNNRFARETFTILESQNKRLIDQSALQICQITQRSFVTNRQVFAKRFTRIPRASARNTNYRNTGFTLRGRESKNRVHDTCPNWLLGVH